MMSVHKPQSPSASTMHDNRKVSHKPILILADSLQQPQDAERRRRASQLLWRYSWRVDAHEDRHSKIRDNA